MIIIEKKFIDEWGGNLITQEFNLQNQLIKETVFCYDNKTIWFIDEYDEDENLTKTITFKKNGTIDFIYEYNQNGYYLTTHHSNTDYVKNEQKKYLSNEK